MAAAESGLLRRPFLPLSLSQSQHRHLLYLPTDAVDDEAQRVAICECCSFAYWTSIEKYSSPTEMRKLPGLQITTGYS